jgi:tRNA nucleotidyltransferase (CCA-adding enzyme)
MTEIRKFEVGGCVRDSIMGRRSKDVDYVVTGFESFEAMAAWVATQGEVFVTTPETFTVRARVGRDVFDYVWARQDGPYSDGRHPDYVTAGTLEDDLARRDFTINAIARAEDGTIIDPHNGRADIEARVIRAVGDPNQRFIEDGLRVLRAIRFAVTFGFSIDPATFHAMQRAAVSVRRVSSERIREEMHKACKADSRFAIEWVQALGIGWWDIIFRDGMWLMPTTKG